MVTHPLTQPHSSSYQSKLLQFLLNHELLSRVINLSEVDTFNNLQVCKLSDSTQGIPRCTTSTDPFVTPMISNPSLSATYDDFNALGC